MYSVGSRVERAARINSSEGQQSERRQPSARRTRQGPPSMTRTDRRETERKRRGSNMVTFAQNPQHEAAALPILSSPKYPQEQSRINERTEDHHKLLKYIYAEYSIPFPAKTSGIPPSSSKGYGRLIASSALPGGTWTVFPEPFGHLGVEVVSPVRWNWRQRPGPCLDRKRQGKAV